MRYFTTLFLPLILLISACSSPTDNTTPSKAAPLIKKVFLNPTAKRGENGNPITLSLNKAIHNISTNTPLYYALDVPAGKTSLVLSFAWGKDYKILGNPNIYISHQKIPTTDNYDCNGEWKAGDSEVCIIDNPKAGTYYILVNPVKVEKAEPNENGEETTSVTANKFEVNDGILFATTDIFNVSYACENAQADIRAQTLTDKQRNFVCDRLAKTQKRFKTQWRAIDTDIVTPIENDLNHRVVAELFSNMKNYTTWMSYLQDSTNNSGVFHEEDPEDAKSPRAAFRTFNGLHWTNGITHYWNLEHEFSHYLDARYLKKGNYSSAVDHKISWWSEGLAQYFGFWNGPERLFTIAHSAIYPTNILTCSSISETYTASREKNIVEHFSLTNESSKTLTLHKVNHETGELIMANKGVTISPNETINGFTKHKWHSGDRFVLQDENKNCVALAAVKTDQTLVFNSERLSSKANTRTLADIFDNKADAYTWGHLGFTFFFEEKKAELKRFIALTKQGNYIESDKLLSLWAVKYEDEFQAWMRWGVKKSFVDAFEKPESQLTLNSYKTLYGAGDWGLKLSLAEDTNSLTIGSDGGYGKYDILVGKDMPAHNVALLNADAVVCKTNKTTNKQHCVIENAKAGEYYITIANQSAVTVLAETHIYACTDNACEANLKLPAASEPEKAPITKTPRIVDSADIKGCNLAEPYELDRTLTQHAENFSVTNNASRAITLQVVNNETGDKSENTIALAAGKTWKPDTTVYNDERISVSDNNGKCLGVLEAQTNVRLAYNDRTSVDANSCSLHENYKAESKRASNASIRNETDNILYVFWIFPDQVANKKTNGLLRRESYAELAPGETWDNITWRHKNRIMLGTTDSTDTAECAAVFEVKSDTHLAVKAK